MLKVILFTLVFIAFASICFAWDSVLIIEDYERIDVVVEELSQDAIDIGLSDDLLNAKVELQLRRNGLIPNDPPQMKDGYLYIT